MPLNKSVTMKDIAERANVSLTTVSRILRQERLDSFSPQTQARVTEAANALGWRRNLLVQGIQTGRTGTVGILAVPFDTFWADVLHGLHDELLATNHVPLLLWPRYEHDYRVDLSELAQLHRLMERRVEAIATWPMVDADAREYLQNHVCPRISVVTIDYSLEDTNSTAIMSGEKQAALQIIEHLTQLGHRRLAYLGPTSRHGWAVSRFREIQRAVDEAGLRPYFRESAVEEEQYENTVHQWLEEPDRPTAIIGATDHVALNICHAARQHNVEIPRKLSIVGYGNLQFEVTIDVPLTTIEQYPKKIGTETARQLIRRRYGRVSGRPERIEITPSLVTRQSTGTCLSPHTS